MITHPDKDLSHKIKWLTQFLPMWGDLAHQNVACAKTCKLILSNAGYASGDRVDIATYDAVKNLIRKPTWQQGMDLIHANFNKDMPFIIGVNRGKVNEGNSNPATMHFVIMIGRKYDALKEHYVYRFADVGTHHEDYGMSEQNTLELSPNGLIKGGTAYMPTMKGLYTITEVRAVS